MRTIHAAISVLSILIGLVHVGGTFVFYDELDPPALWFLGSGLFVVSLGLLNVGILRSGGRDSMMRYTTGVLNGAGFVMGLLAVSRVGGPPSYALAALFLTATLLVLFGYRERADGGRDRSGG